MFRKLLYLITPLILCPATMHADPIRVRFTQGTEHGYLALRNEGGQLIGRGDIIAVVHGSRVSEELSMHFNDGSIDDETTVYTQNDMFRLVSDHHIQKGPLFPSPLDMLVENNGNVTLRSAGKDGKEKIETQHISLPADISNGIIGVLLSNLSPRGPAHTFSMVVPALGKGRLVKLVVAAEGQQKFTEVGQAQTADVYRVHIDLGGVMGVVAPIVGRQPADVFIWIAGGIAPQLVRLLGPLAEGSPVVSIELSGGSFEPGPAHSSAVANETPR